MRAVQKLSVIVSASAPCPACACNSVSGFVAQVCQHQVSA